MSFQDAVNNTLGLQNAFRKGLQALRAEDRAHGATEVIRKLEWLREWLEAGGLLLSEFPSESVWVASGNIQMSKTSPQARALSKSGLQFPRRILHI